MNDNDYLNILEYGKPSGTISIQPHPEDIIDVDPEIMANYKAFLKDEDYSKAYDITDRVIDDLALQREKIKLKRIFGNSAQILESVSSIKNIKTIKEEIKFEEVDLELLKEYSFIKTREENIDQVDFYRSFLFDEEFITKNKRVLQSNEILTDKTFFKYILDDYKDKHFEVLSISREVIQLNTSLSNLFKKRKLASMFDDFLSEFYGMKI
jgi:hypothetical protein